jgi:Tol biopolymer transport system component
MNSDAMPADSNSAIPADDRLDSWKEIATYLRKGVRTVQRWERTDGLPVRRLGQDRAGSVFAYKTELDAWWETRSRRAAPETDVEPAALMPPAARRWRRLLLVLAPVLLTAVVLWQIWPPAPVIYRPIPLTAEHGRSAQPSFSPDGRRIAYSWTPPEGRPAIYVTAVGSETRVRLTRGTAPETNPAWSPDGRLIAFLHSLEPEPAFALTIVPASGGVEVPIAQLTVAGGLSWSADGQWLIAKDGTPKMQSIVAVAVATGAKHALTAPFEFGYFGARLSPEADRLVFGRAGPGATAIYELPLGPGLTPQGESRRLTGNLFTTDLLVTPDTREVIYADGTWEEGEGLFRLRLGNGAQPQLIHATADRYFSPAISGDGKRLAFGVNRLRREDIWRKSLVDPAAGPTPLISSTHSDLNQQYSPDGRSIAFHSTRSGASDIWIAASDGSNPRRLTYTNARTTATPRWSPGGQWVAFESNLSGQTEIYAVRSTGGPVRRLTDHPSTDAIPSWSRDGRTLYFCSDRTGRFELWKMPVQGGTPTQVTQGGGFAAVESPDGAYLYYSQTRNFGPVVRVPLAGGRAETIIPEIRGLFYDVTPRGIYFQNGRAISFWDRASGGISTVYTPPKPMAAGLSVSPDGQFLLYTQVETAPDTELYLIDGLR